jgi:hypothetical protein
MKQSDISPERILQVGFGFWASSTLLSAIELGVFTRLAVGPRSASALQTELGLHPRSALDFLDALVAMGFLQRENSNYINSPDSDKFLDENKPSYIGGMFQRLFRSWGMLTDSLKTGKPVGSAENAEKTFDHLYSSPERMRGFLSTMTAISLSAARAMAEKFPWEDYKTFADIGTAQGALPVNIALKHPHLKGTGFDLPMVRPVFEEFVNSFALGDRINFTPGDFFKDDLPRVDVIVMGHILHDWDLEQKKFLIKKAYDALPDGGALVVYEALIDDERKQNTFGLLMSLNMLVETHGGFDYTGADCTAWMHEAGFRQTRVEPLVGPDSMVIGTK